MNGYRDEWMERLLERDISGLVSRPGTVCAIDRGHPYRDVAEVVRVGCAQSV